MVANHGSRMRIDLFHICRQISFIAWFCLWCSVPVQSAGKHTIEEADPHLRIIMDSEWCVMTAPGYWPIRFDITNLGNDRVIELYGEGRRWWDMSLRMGMPDAESSFEIHQSIPLKRSEHVKITVPVPIFADNENLKFEVRERGRILQSFSHESLQSNKPPETTSALIVADMSSPFGAFASSLPRPFSSGHAPMPGFSIPMAGIMDFILDPLRLPADWHGLTSVIAVIIGSQEWEKLTAPQKEALLAWTASGGNLAYADGDLSMLFPDPQTRPANLALREGNYTPYYWGRIHLFKSAELGAVGLPQTLAQLSARSETGDFALPLNRAPDRLVFSPNGFRLAIPGVGVAPVRSYFIILIAFSVLIGPVNFMWLRKKHRLILLVFTAPLISVVFILLLSGYAIFGEGLGITGRVQSFTLLDQKTNRAATRATISLYAAGMAPGKGLQFSRDAAIFPLGHDNSGNHESQLLDFTKLQQFSSGLAKARTPSNFEEITFRPSRGGLSFSRAAGGIVVANHLEATVTRLFYREDGKVYLLDLPLKAGEKALLHSTEKSSLGELPARFQSFPGIQADRTYIAWLESSPFVEMGVSNVKERDSLHLVLGYVGEKQ
jgi:hypothetical protein